MSRYRSDDARDAAMLVAVNSLQVAAEAQQTVNDQEVTEVADVHLAKHIFLPVTRL
jgi:hypothetical protein